MRFLTALLLSVAAGPLFATTSFVAARSTSAGFPVEFATFTDLDHDGKIDIVAGGNGLAVLMNNGDGTFRPTLSLPGYAIEAVAAGDVTGDGKADLVVIDGTFIEVFPGKGNGTFGNAIQTPQQYQMYNAVLADIDRDGKLDLVSQGFGDPGQVVVWRGRGNGTFAGPEAYDVGALPLEVVIADFNGDGWPDVATIVQTLDATGATITHSTVAVLLNRGDGTLRVATTVGDLPPSRGLAAADVNGDGHPDLLVASTDDPSVTELLGRGDGTFDPHRLPLAAPLIAPIAAGDFTGRGTVDLAGAVTVSGVRQAVVLAGRGDGTFEETSRTPIAGSIGAIIDLDGDGIADLAALPTYDHYGIAVAHGLGGGRFLTATTYSVSGSSHSSAHSIASADLDHDGNLDLITTDRGANQVSVLRGNPDGTFQSPVTYGVAAPDDLVLSDINRDGEPDIVALQNANASVAVLLNRGDGTFGAAATYPIGVTGPFTGLNAADLNGDGIPDLIVGYHRAVAVAMGTADGSFAFRSIDLSSFFNGLVVQVLAKDFDRDGKIDLLVTIQPTGNNRAIVFLKGAGDGTFAAPVFTKQYPGVGYCTAADVNGDGILDLVGQVPRAMMVAFGNGDGTFANAVLYPSDSVFLEAPVIIDLDGDGLVDVVAPEFSADEVAVYIGNGNGTFQAPVRFAALSGPVKLVVGDFDHDGRPDLAVSHFSADAISVLHNDCSPSAWHHRAGKR